ncbi:MAG: hypothetical protein DSY70_01830 [Desulfobulbus sp.]|nr:MAG: hypothetical protein DSY70_01830 [Desulfobulbus sp.]
MESKSKKIIKISLVTLLFSIIFVCIFWPKLFVFYLTNVLNAPYLDVKPIIITQLNSQRGTHPSLNIGLVKANLNPTKIKKIKFSENLFLNIEYDTYYLLIFPWQSLENKEELYFSKYYEIINTTTEDAKILNNPGVNITVSINLILKAIMMTSDHIEIINADDLKIISQLFIGEEKNKMMLNIYDPNNKYSQLIFIEPKNNQVDLHQKYSLFIKSVSPTNIENDFNQLMAPLSLRLQKNISMH